MTKLTPREKEALDLLAKGMFYKEVAADNRTEALNKYNDK